MKLQHLTIIFAIIFLPIILITSYYIQKQVDTINLQLAYDSKILNATYDALTAFELNTADEDLSDVSDSLRSIIDASNNILLNTLATNMGVSNASKSFVQPYIPAIVYTLYDGYYIYSPARVPVVCADKFGQTISTDSVGVKYVGEIDLGNNRTIGEYEFDPAIIEYIDGSTEPKSDADSQVNRDNKVDYNSLPNKLKVEYGQQLYENKNGNYSTVLHSTGADTDTKYKQSYILKSYIPYSANYSDADPNNPNSGNFNININYTLDNYISINGTIGDVYYTKCGYLIDNSLVKKVTVDDVVIKDGNVTNKWYTYSEEDISKLIHDPENHKVIVELKNSSNIEGGTQDKPISISNQDNMIKVKHLDGTEEEKYWDDVESAVEYYVEAWMFSSWVYENLGNGNQTQNNVLIEKNIKSTYDIALGESQTQVNDYFDRDEITAHQDKLVHDFSGSDNAIFNVDEDPEGESTFREHKLNVMRNSINYNLALAVVSYSEMSSTKEFDLPILKDSEWDKLLSNISILVFMQGMNCGLKTYSNYALVSSTNNEITVTPSEIYYVPYYTKTDGRMYSEYYINGEYDNANEIPWLTDLTDDLYAPEEIAHRIDCPELGKTGTQEMQVFGNQEPEWYISFKSKDVKYDKIYDTLLGRYMYDHKALLDYKCIVSGNYNLDDVNVGTLKLRGNTDLVSAVIDNDNKLRAYRIAVGKERNNLYKSIKYDVNGGYKIINKCADDGTGGDNVPCSVDLGSSRVKEIYKIQIVLQGIKNSNRNIAADTLQISLGGNLQGEVVVSTRGGESNITTYEFFVDNPSSSLSIGFAKGSTAILKSVKVYYK